MRCTGLAIALALLASTPSQASGDVVVRSRESLIRVDSSTGSRTLFSGRNTFADLALTPDGELLALTNGVPSVVAIGPASGQRRTISSPQRGTGAIFAGPKALDVAPDGGLFVLESVDDECTVLRVDPETGDRSLVSGAERGAGPALDHCQALAAGPDGTLYVLTPGWLLAIDPETGDRSALSGHDPGGANPIGAGPSFHGVRNMTVDADGIWVLDTKSEMIWNGQDLSYILSLHRVVHVDLATGDRTIVSDTDQELDPLPMNEFVDVARPAPGMLLLFDDQLVVLVDEATGARTAIDVPFRVAAAIVGNADAVYVAWTGWQTLGGIARVEIPSGDSTELADDRVGGGPPFSTASYPDPGARALAVDSRGRLLATAHETLFRVHPITGHRTILSDPTTGAGPSLGSRPGSIAVLQDGRIFVAASLPGERVIEVDPANGNRTLVSGDGVGGGPELPPHGCSSLAPEPEGTLLCVASSLDAQQEIVFRIDPATGDRSELVTNPLFGAFSIGDLIALGGDQAYFTDPIGDAWYRLDLATRVATLISKLGVGSGPRPEGPSGITLRPNGAILSGDSNGRGVALLRIDPASGNRALVSGQHPTQTLEIGDGPWGVVDDVVYTPEPSASQLGLVAAALLLARARSAR